MRNLRAQFQFAAIPIAYPQLDSFDFLTPTMRSLFQFGYKCAQAGRRWSSSKSAGHDEANRGDTGIGQPNHCPADDEYIGRLAVPKAKSSAESLPVANYKSALARAVAWLGDRYLLAKPINSEYRSKFSAQPAQRE
jgi:hypothetical protein